MAKAVKLKPADAKTLKENGYVVVPSVGGFQVAIYPSQIRPEQHAALLAGGSVTILAEIIGSVEMDNAVISLQ